MVGFPSSISYHSNYSYSLETNEDLTTNHRFTVSSNDRKAWAMQGGDLLCDFMSDEGKYYAILTI